VRGGPPDDARLHRHRRAGGEGARQTEPPERRGDIDDEAATPPERQSRAHQACFVLTAARETSHCRRVPTVALAGQRLRTLAQWSVLGTLVGIACGAASALFLWLLDEATTFRTAHDGVVYTLPLAGLAIGWVYERFGRPIKGGNNLVIDTLHDAGPELPLRMAPMVLFGTVLTHLFGGSAGREGTAVQMGASLADWLSHRLRLGPDLRRQVLAAGVAGGFGSVFGTPIAGTVFGLEFVVLGAIQYDALVPALVASVVGDMVTRSLGIAHTHYAQAPSVPLTPVLLLKWHVFAAAMAAASAAFIELTHALKRLGERYLHRLPVRMAVGGVAVVGLWQLVGTSDYLGLGVPMIARAFEDPAFPAYAFVLKLLFTAVTLGAGYLGGEVTPLFFVGAALGSVLARFLDIPIPLGAGVGLAAVFAASANTPLALSIMAMELLGSSTFPHVAIVCVLAYLLTGHRSIYPAQRVLRGKGGSPLPHPRALRDLHAPSPRRDTQESARRDPA
jgi:H+/Cl- antiporter ClcA